MKVRRHLSLATVVPFVSALILIAMFVSAQGPAMPMPAATPGMEEKGGAPQPLPTPGMPPPPMLSPSSAGNALEPQGQGGADSATAAETVGAVERASTMPTGISVRGEGGEMIPFDEEKMRGAASPGEGDNLINVSVYNETLENVVNMFTRLSGANIVATSANLDGLVTVNLTDVEWKPALSSILDIHGLALVEKMPGSSVYSIMEKPPQSLEPRMVETFFLKYTTVEEVGPIITAMLSLTNSTISPFSSRNALVVKADEANLREIERLLTKMDQPSEQVCVETKFMELSDKAAKQLGIKWDSLEEFGVRLGAGPFEYAREKNRDWTTSSRDATAETWTRQNVSDDSDEKLTAESRAFDSAGNQILQTQTTWVDHDNDPNTAAVAEYTEIPTTTKNSSLLDSDKLKTEYSSSVASEFEKVALFSKQIVERQAAVLELDTLDLVLSALKRTDGVSIISNPKIIVTSGATNAMFRVGEREPIIRTEITRGTTESPGDKVTAFLDDSLNTEYIQKGYLKTGIELQVVPVVKTDEMIEAFVQPKLVRRLLPDKVVGDNSWPRISVKEIQTRFTLRSGQSVAIGGLTDTSDSKEVSKIPLLGDIPLLGKYLFSHTKEVKNQIETIIFVTLTLAPPVDLFKEAGIPENSELVHKRMIEGEKHRQQFQAGIEEMKRFSDIKE